MRQTTWTVNGVVAGRSDRRELLRTLGVGLPIALIAGWVPKPSVNGQTVNRAETESRFLLVNGVKLHYLEWGARDASPLLLLHPAPLNAYVWDAFGPAMAPHYRVIAPDARGFGDSEWSDSYRYSNDVFIEDLRALITVLGLKRPILCGNSMGGALAFIYASLYPDDVDRLILVDTAPSAPEAGTPVVQTGSRRAGPPPLPAGPFMSPEDAAAQVSKNGWPPAFVKAMVQHNLKQDVDGQWHWKFDQQGTAGGLERAIGDPRNWPRWRAVKCPTLILRGERSPALPQRVAEQAIKENKNALLEIVPNAGHFIPIEQPVAFEAAVRKWLGV